MYGDDFEELVENLGDVHALARDYGSVGQAVSDTIQRQDNAEAVVLTIMAENQGFTQDIADLHTRTDDTEFKILDFVKRLAERTSRQVSSINQLIQNLQRGGHGAPMVAVDMDTIFGTEAVGASNVDVNMNYIFAQLRGTASTVDELASRYKNSGVAYQGHSFASPEEFSRWYMVHNPMGSGMAAMVDFVSIWCFL